MGCGDNGGGGGKHPTTLFEYFEKTRIPGFKRRIEIRINTIESLQDQYVSGVESYLLFLGKAIRRTFYPVYSPGAKKILEKYKPEFA